MNLNIIPPGWSLPPMPVDLAAAALAAPFDWIEGPGSKPRLPPGTVDAIRRLAAQGMTDRQIAEALNVNARTAWRYSSDVKREMGTRPRDRAWRSTKRIAPDTIARIKRLAANGLSTRDIGQELGISYKTAQRHLKRMRT